jgi:hypothetical protein
MSHGHDTAEQSTAHPGYETRDVSIRAVLWLGVGIALGTLLVAGMLWLLLANFKRQSERRDRQLSPLAADRGGPPEPRLQNTPLADYREFRAREDRVLSSYGWVDKEKGTVRIPIERAMELLVERGEPAAQEANSSEEALDR